MASDSEFAPSYQRLTADATPVEVFLRLSHLPHVVFFDSALQHQQLGRWSFVAADPFAWLEFSGDSAAPLDALEAELAKYSTASVPELPPFQGGASGLFGYELGRRSEPIAAAKYDEFAAPVLACGLYDVVIAFDHQSKESWIISQGFPETEYDVRRERAQARLRHFLELLDDREAPQNKWCPQCESHRTESIDRAEMAPLYSTSAAPDLLSNFSADGYRAAVEQAVGYIYAGDVFQVNLSQRLLHPAATNSIDLYLRMRDRNAATFAGYFDLGKFQICSASPERFLAVRDRRVETRPIKGTRRRAHWPEADLFTGDELRQSKKDRSENVMIVDLLRNDLSRVCKPESVCVTQLCDLESYAFVQHLVSAVEGDLQIGKTALDQLRAAFPGGSITGAPKIRAMQIIAELEPTARGAYCGSLGYIGFDGTMDSSILIRTITCGRGWWQLPVGGGIVADSDPQQEYEETWQKAEGMLRALQP